MTAFDAQTEAEDAGIPYTPDQWSFAKRSKGQVPARRGDTVRMTEDELRVLTDACRTG